MIADGFYRVTTSYACGAVTIARGHVVKNQTAPIFVRRARAAVTAGQWPYGWQVEQLS